MVIICWKLYDTLIFLNLRDLAYLYITKQSCTQHVFYRPIYGTAPRAYDEKLSVFHSNKPRVVSGSQPKRSSKIVE